MVNWLENTDTYLIRIPKENESNDKEAIRKKVIVENFPELRVLRLEESIPWVHKKEFKINPHLDTF